MPQQLTYPGVYVQEISSGVHTIMGVSTSATVFVGKARLGPIDRAVRVTSFADYERRFGGLLTDSEMSYAVRQFFTNGGSEAWIIRVAAGAQVATLDLVDAQGAASVRVSALDKGEAGRSIFLEVDHETAIPASQFRLTATYWPAGAPSPVRTETFTNLSMNSKDRRYVETVVKNESTLIKAERLAAIGGIQNTKGTSGGAPIVDAAGVLLDVSTLIDERHNELRIQSGNTPPVKVVLNKATDVGAANATAPQRLTALCAAIQAKAQAASGNHATFSGNAFCARDDKSILFTCGVAGEQSQVRILPGERNDITTRLRLGSANGGIETDAVAALRPKKAPDAASLKSATIQAGDVSGVPDATHTQFQISLDGYPAQTVDLGTVAAVGANTNERMTDLAARIQSAVRALKSAEAYKKFECVADTVNKVFVLSSGTRGAESSIVVSAGLAKDLAGSLRLLTGSVTSSPTDAALQGGSDGTFDPGDYAMFIGDQAARTGLYALEAVDIFNLLVLPGVKDPGILADAAAYCESRRAFLLIDSPIKGDESPDPVSTMETTVGGTALPKSRNAAVFFPWVRIADPLDNGNLRLFSPLGTVAGLYARTDSDRGVWKAPAGTEARLVGVQEVAYAMTDRENGVLNPHGVNCLRVLPVFGAICWGARTLRGDDQMADEWKYVPVRRTALFIEESLFRGSKWIVFEPNDEPLWAQIRLNFGAFMHTLFRQGAFQGTSPKDAYFVKCDRETTTQDDINHGIVNIEVGFAPLKPAEFVVIKLAQMAGQIQT